MTNSVWTQILNAAASLPFSGLAGPRAQVLFCLGSFFPSQHCFPTGQGPASQLSSSQNEGGQSSQRMFSARKISQFVRPRSPQRLHRLTAWTLKKAPLSAPVCKLLSSGGKCYSWDGGKRSRQMKQAWDPAPGVGEAQPPLFPSFLEDPGAGG